ncbi:phosphate ABC transporter ATP-binding protein, PhoT family [Desulfacinum hydrothermale DSM 13146]|uniref:Phosphate ABC transporter ATP-binding protein, PhoT family n=1 Tax=Desulfacinum hydrothermale DSM 13146 TaxID=1121390 RepID=A0A1W1XFP1_9BACT|nr:phosphate ABC transporter ATP-binding protein [Desulfacinum hydrothermale]SMC22584.1 phosphate ABC transporter ATP-binding protein, PhoT family [Desulfacinum hydrothermale DSM 13146]
MDPVVKIRVEGLTFRYGARTVLREVSALFLEGALAAIVGPSGRGKSTFLMALNRLWEEVPGAHAQGRVWVRLDGRERLVSDPSFPATELRRRVAMVFQAPNPLRMSIFNNVAFPLKVMGQRNKRLVAQEVEGALRRAFLWDEVKDRLDEDARRLSGGQQQRLCIARALAAQPDVLLLDEPTSSLDARAAGVIEDLLLTLKRRCTLVVVSHYLEQVERLADQVYEVAHETLEILS